MTCNPTRIDRLRIERTVWAFDVAQWNRRTGGCGERLCDGPGTRGILTLVGLVVREAQAVAELRMIRSWSKQAAVNVGFGGS